MATFNSKQEQNKWNSLKSKSDKPFNKLLEGTATSKDIEQLTNLIGQYSDLAKEVFEEALDATVETANSIVKEASRTRKTSGKKPISDKAQDALFEKTFKEILTASAVDIIGTVEDTLKQQVGAHSDAKIRTKLTELLHQLPSSGDIDKDELDTLLRTSAVGKQDPVSSRFKNFFNKPKLEIEPEEEPVGRTPAKAASEKKAKAEESLSTQATGISIESTAPILLLSPKTEDAVVDSVSNQHKFHDLVSRELLRKRTDDKKDKSRDKDREQESWFRRLANWMGSHKSKAKSGSSWFSSMMKALMLVLTAPALINTIVSAFKEYVTFDNIEAFMTRTWDDLKLLGNSAIDTVLTKLGLNKNAVGDAQKAKTKTQLRAEAGTTVPRVESQIKYYENVIAKEKAARAKGETTLPSDYTAGKFGGMLGGSTSDEKYSSMQGQLQSLYGMRDQYRQATSPLAAGGGFTYDAKTQTYTPTTSSATTGSVGGVTSPVNVVLPNSDVNSTVNLNNTSVSNTTVAGLGVAAGNPLVIADTTAQTPTMNYSSGGGGVSQTNALSLASFNFQPSNSDMLLLYNQGH